MKLIQILSILSVLLSTMAGVEAATVAHEKAKVQLSYPDDWKSQGDENSLMLTSPDDEVVLVFFVSKATQIDKALEEADEALEKNLGGVTWDNDGKGTEENNGSLPCVEWSGSAKEGAVVVHCVSFDTPSDHALGVYYFATKEADEKHDAVIQKIFADIKPIEKGPAMKQITHEQGKVKFSYPETWTQEIKEENLVLTSPNGDVGIVFFLADQEEINKVLEEVDKELEKGLGDITWDNEGNASEYPDATLPTNEWSGTAKEGTMVVHCLAMDTPADKALGIYYFATKEADEKLDKEIMSIFNSIEGLK